METFSALLAFCAGNSPVPDEFPSQRPVTRSFDVSFDLCLNTRLCKQSWGWWFETLSRSLWRRVRAQTHVMHYLLSFQTLPCFVFQNKCMIIHRHVYIITMTSQWTRWRLKSPASPMFTQPLIRAQIKENIKAPRHWPLCGRFTGDRWIPRTNGQ